MLKFYISVRADDVDLDEDGDMLLFQWGTYGYDEQRSFQYDITRQFILFSEDDDHEDDQSLWQLSVTSHFVPTADTDALGAGNRWCSTPADVVEFRRFIDDSEATVYATASSPSRVEISFGGAG